LIAKGDLSYKLQLIAFMQHFSYVWGPKASETSHEGLDPCGAESQLSSLIPRTVDDAILLTQHLGWEYLWVDRYCIDQSDNDDKREQIWGDV
jgi:hypothetical protein